MAQVIANPIYDNRNDVIGFEWLNLTENDTADHVEVPHKADKTVQVSDNFGTVGDVRVEGSLDPDGIIFNELSDPQGTTIGILTAGPRIKAILENVFFIRPNVGAGTGVSVNVRILMK